MNRGMESETMQPDVDLTGGQDGRYVLSFLDNLDRIAATKIVGSRSPGPTNDLFYHDGAVTNFVASASTPVDGRDKPWREFKPCLQCEALFFVRWKTLRGVELFHWPAKALDEFDVVM